MKQAILVTLFFLGFVSFTYAQKITGKVTDKSTGETVIAATVYVKGNTSTGTVTDMDGNFSLNLSQGAKVLVISYMGMQTQEVPIGNKIQAWGRMPRMEGHDEELQRHLQGCI